MILSVAVALGLLCGLVWAGWSRVRYEAPVLHHLWLVLVASIAQIGNQPSVFFLTLSQVLFISFVFFNRKHVGMKFLLLGALLNFCVMVANSGLMPINPETAEELISEEAFLNFSLGDRFGAKDIFLAPEQTRFEWLADRFLPPTWFPYQVAFSLGDVFIAIGVFRALAKPKMKVKEGPHGRTLLSSASA